MLVELIGAAVYTGCAFVLISLVGIEGAALANIAYFVCYLAFMYNLLRRRGGGWDDQTKILLLINAGATVIAAAALRLDSGWMVQLGAFFVTGTLSVVRFHRLLQLKHSAPAEY